MVLGKRLDLNSMLRRQGLIRGGATALFDDFGRTTYSELDLRSRAIADWVAIEGLRQKEVVLHLKRDRRFVVTLLGLLRGGAICVPMDGEDHPKRKAAILSQLDNPIVISELPDHDRGGGWGPDVDTPTSCRVIDVADLPDRPERADNTESDSIPAEWLAFIFFTSGSSGLPKGVLLTHDAVMAGQHWLHETFGGSPEDCFLFRSPTSVTNIVRESIWPLLAGARSYVLERGLHRDAAAHIEAVNKHRIRVLAVTPSLLDVMMDDEMSSSMGSLKLVIVTSDNCRATTVSKFQHRRLESRLINIYGLTEALYGSYQDLTEAKLGISDPVSVGYPAELSVDLLDDNWQPAAAGSTGELYLSGVGTAAGYYKNPLLTAERILELPRGRRRFRTGDTARFGQKGELYIVGRRDLQLKIHGHRIETEEVEAALLAQNGISQVGVVKREVDGISRLVAFYAGSKAPSSLQLRRSVSSVLPGYAVPTLIIHKQALPLTSSQKVDREALKIEVITTEESSLQIAEPETPAETVVLAAWKDCLKCEAIGVDTDFFEVGGDSILAMLIAARARKLNVALTVADFFSSRTIRKMCALAGSRTTGHKKELPVSKADHHGLETSGPLNDRFVFAGVERIFSASPMETGMLFHTILEPTSGVYYEQLTHRIEGNVDLELFKRAWETVTRASGALRSCFLWEHGGDVQHVVLKQVTLDWHTYDASHLPRAGAENILEQTLRSNRASCFDLRKGPLFKLSLLKLATADYLFTVHYHHILLDAWSFYLILKSVLTVYQSLTLGQDLPPPGVTDTFDSYVSAMSVAPAHAEKAFWKEYLRGYSDSLFLCSRKSAGSGHGDCCVVLEDRLGDDLRRLAKCQGVTVNTVFVAAWLALLAVLTGRSDVCCGMIITLRQPVIEDIDKVVGVCVNTIPVRTRYSSEERRDDYLARLFKEQENLRRFENVPISDIQAGSELRPGVPLFDSLLIFENFQVDSKLAMGTGYCVFECVRYDGWTNYPLSLTINHVNDMTGLIDPELTPDSVGNKRVVIRFKSDRRYLADSEVRKVGEQFRSCLQAMVDADNSMRMITGKIRPSIQRIEAGQSGNAGASEELGMRGPRSNDNAALVNQITEVFSSVLGANVSSDANFFDSGGTSFKALMVVSRLQQLYRVEIPLLTIFKHPVAGAIANVIAASGYTAHRTAYSS
jgi:amino acid adenylation domain-containing protein